MVCSRSGVVPASHSPAFAFFYQCDERRTAGSTSCVKVIFGT
jgi:hypothetical protein